MRVLLDTHCWLWWLTEPEKLSQSVYDLLADRKSEVYLSVASIWEIGIKFSIGKLPLPQAPEKLIPREMAADGLLTLDIKSIHALKAVGLPMQHRDPFDRMLIAQSQVEQLPIMTTDPVFDQYTIKVIW